MLRSNLSTLVAWAVLFAASACGGHAVPASSVTAFSAQRSYVRPDDTTSILKKLTKDVVIGSTIDVKNGDKGPRSILIVPCNCNGNLSQGQLLVCNFEDSSGAPGKGTTLEALDPSSGSKPTRFVQSKSIEGCDGDALTSINEVYGAGLTSREVVEFSNRAVPVKTYHGGPIAAPFSDADGLPLPSFSPEYIFVGSTASGGIVSISIGFYGNGKALQVAKGFGVSTKPVLAPSGLQYSRGLDALYIVDGVTNTVVAFSNASYLLEKDEIVVKPDGKTFTCLHPKVTCATLVYSGKPLDAPLASALLPNGNLIVANTQGTANTLVELTPQGQVLDTKVVDKKAKQGVFGLVASGTNDYNTVLFFTDTNSNNVQELEQ